MPRGPRKEYSAAAQAHSDVQPPRAPTGLPQGEHKALIDSQKSVPIPNAAGRTQMAIQQALQGGQPPLGDGAMMLNPTGNPLEPVTHGLPIGAGAGPEAIAAPAVPTTVDDYAMAGYLPMLEALADRPNTTAATRAWVRRVRGTLPANITMQSIVKPQS